MGTKYKYYTTHVYTENLGMNNGIFFQIEQVVIDPQWGGPLICFLE